MELSWQERASGMLANERKMQPLHRPPSTGCLVVWRDRTLVGCVQHPVDPVFPAIVFLSVTSVYVDPEYIRAVRELDPGRLELVADPLLDLNGNFHVLRREDNRLTFMTPVETRHMAARGGVLIELTPTPEGFSYRGVVPVEARNKP